MILLLVSSIVSSQNLPFPQNTTYTSGTIKPNHKTSIQLNSDATAFYNLWKVAYLKNNCANTAQYYVNYDQGESNVSEGTGYGMIITAMMAGYDVNAKTYFDGLYYFYKAHPAKINKDLMAWKQVKGCVDENPGNTNSATDGDVDIAFGLVAAHAQWGSLGSINYLQEAKNIINAIMKDEINPSNYSVELGDWVNSGSGNYFNATRSSDFVLSHFKSFEYATGDTKWTTVYEKCQNIISTIQTNNSPNTGLLPDFIVSANTTPIPSPANFLEGGNDGNYHYNACRDPWRIGADYLITGDSRSKTAVNKINNWLKAKYPNPTDIETSFTLAGNVSGGNYREMCFLAPFMVGYMVDATHQTYLNNLYDYVVAQNIGFSDYYGNTIKMICLLIASGNYIPAITPSVAIPICPKPNLGINQSLCGSVNGITLNSTIPNTTNKTISWFKNNASTGSNTTTLKVTQAGTYIVKVDSINCSQADTIIITASIETPNLGSSITLCAQPSATLDAGVSGNGITYVWEKDNSVIANANNQTLNVNSAGIYKVTLSSVGCSSTNAQVTVSSTLLDVTGNTICKSGDQATLNINANGVGPFYWYDAITNGNLLFTGKSYAKTYNTATTIYAQEGAGVSGTIGGTSLIVGNAPWSPNPMTYYTSLKFTTYKPNLLISSVDIYIPNGAKANNFIISVLSSGGTVLGSSSAIVVNNTTGNVQKVTVPLDVTISTPAVGYQIAFTSATFDNYNSVYQGTSTVYPITESSNSISLTGGNLTFNNIIFSSGSNCARTPVDVIIDPVKCTITDLLPNDETFENIYPNPVLKNAVFSLKNPSQINEIIVYDLNGIQVYKSKEINNMKADLPTGIYSVKITKGNNILFEKLIIQ